MPLDFPTSPTDGRQYNGYVYSSATGAWRGKAASSSPVYTSATAPANPVAGDMWWNSNDGTMYVYYKDADAYQWVEVRSQIAKSQVGLVPVVPTSVTVTGGTATVNGSGAISFTTASTIALNGVFSSTYRNYKLVLNIDTASVTNAGFYEQLVASGTAATTGLYNWAGTWGTSAGAGPGLIAGASQTSWYVVEMVSGYAAINHVQELFNPFLTKETAISGSGTTYSNAWRGVTYGGFHQSTTSYDGVKFTATSGTVTGTLQIFGYNG